MKIVTEAQLKDLPEGAVYSEYIGSGETIGLFLKGETWRDKAGEALTWVYTSLLGELDRTSSDDLYAKFAEMEKGEEYPASFHESTRDSLYDHDRLFLVYSPEDVRGLASALLKTQETRAV